GVQRRQAGDAEIPLIPYAEAMRAYGSDKPDLRNPIKIVDVSDEFNDPSVTFNAFKNIIKAGGVVRAIPASGAAAKPRSWVDNLNDWARNDLKAGGLAYIVFQKVEPAKVEAGGPIVKFVPPEVLLRMANKAGLKSGDVLFFSAGKEADAARVAGGARPPPPGGVHPGPQARAAAVGGPPSTLDGR